MGSYPGLIVREDVFFMEDLHAVSLVQVFQVGCYYFFHAPFLDDCMDFIELKFFPVFSDEPVQPCAVEAADSLGAAEGKPEGHDGVA